MRGANRVCLRDLLTRLEKAKFRISSALIDDATCEITDRAAHARINRLISFIEEGYSSYVTFYVRQFGAPYYLRIDPDNLAEVVCDYTDVPALRDIVQAHYNDWV